MLRGALAAAVTPLRDGGEALDEDAFAPYVDFLAAARACDPTPFYVYEFAARSGYAVPVTVLEQLRDAAPNFRGLKVSDVPWERFAPYLVEGLDIFVGPEALIPQGLAGGAVGVVSALGSAFPELIVEAVRDPESADLAPVRTAIERFPFQSALKTVLARRGVPITPDVRRPLRTLTQEERAELEAWLELSLPAPAR